MKYFAYYIYKPIVLMILFLLISSINLNAQKQFRIEKGITLKEAFSRIEKGGNFLFSYSNSKDLLDKTVTSTINNSQINVVLTTLLAETKYSYRIAGQQIVVFYDKNKKIKKDDNKIEPKENGSDKEVKEDNKNKTVIKQSSLSLSRKKTMQFKADKPYLITLSTHNTITKVENVKPPIFKDLKKEKPKQTLAFKINPISTFFYGGIGLAVEWKISEKLSLDFSGSYNPWTFQDNRKIKHILLQPELRYWFEQTYSKHFIGVHSHWSYYNVGNTKLPITFHDRYQGWLSGAGITYGYRYNMNDRWALEGLLGLGYAHFRYDQYEYQNCGDFIKKSSKNYVGPTKFQFNIIYIYK